MDDMKNNLFWWLENGNKPGVYFLDHMIIANKLKKLLPWEINNLVYEGSDYDFNTEAPESTEATVFGTSCDLLYNDYVFNRITFLCFEDLKTVRIEFETEDNPHYFPFYDISFLDIERSCEVGRLVKAILI